MSATMLPSSPFNNVPCLASFYCLVYSFDFASQLMSQFSSDRCPGVISRPPLSSKMLSTLYLFTFISLSMTFDRTQLNLNSKWCISCTCITMMASNKYNTHISPPPVVAVDNNNKHNTTLCLWWKGCTRVDTCLCEWVATIYRRSGDFDSLAKLLLLLDFVCILNV